MSEASGLKPGDLAALLSRMAAIEARIARLEADRIRHGPAGPGGAALVEVLASEFPHGQVFSSRDIARRAGGSERLRSVLADVVDLDAPKFELRVGRYLGRLVGFEIGGRVLAKTLTRTAAGQNWFFERDAGLCAVDAVQQHSKPCTTSRPAPCQDA